MEIKSKEELRDFIIKSQNHNYSRESYWKNNLSNFYDDLLTWDFPDCFSFKQKVYHYINDDIKLVLGICPECSKRCKLKSIVIGYREFCSKDCVRKSILITQKKKETYKSTCLEKYGCEYPAQSEIVQEKMKQTCLEKYGVENPFQSEKVKEKIKQTTLIRYGCDHAASVEEIKEKKKQTCLKIYGCENVSQSKEIKEKKKQTIFNRYGKECYFQTEEYKEKARQTCLEKYGVENPSQSKEIKEKKKQTSQKHYKSDWYFQSEEFKKKFDDYEWVENKLEQTKRSNLEKFGTEWYFQSEECREVLEEKYKNYEWVKSIQEKIYNTKKKNNSFNTSKIEDQLQQYLTENNIPYIYQYTSDKYPFNCDFYFPDRDLYVEIQGSWTHGPNPFTNSEEDKILLEKWKFKGTDFYKSAIETWTIRDVKKRAIAKENRLNYLEIFSCELDECLKQINIYI